MPMRIFKWSPGFHVERESPIAPVWITLPRLPIQLFHPEALFQLCRLIGTPLRMDSATQSLKRPSLARVQIEIDVLKPRPDRVWIDMEDLDGFWQRVEYEGVPDYCTHCWHVGHSESICHVHHPELRAMREQPRQEDAQENRIKQAYVATARPNQYDNQPMQQPDHALPDQEPRQSSLQYNPTTVVSTLESNQAIVAVTPQEFATGIQNGQQAPLDFPVADEQLATGVKTQVQSGRTQGVVVLKPVSETTGGLNQSDLTPTPAVPSQQNISESPSVQQVAQHIEEDMPAAQKPPSALTSQTDSSAAHLVAVTPYPKKLTPSQPINIDGGEVFIMQQPMHIPSPQHQQKPQSSFTATVQETTPVDSLAMVISSKLNAQSDSTASRAENKSMRLQDFSSPTTHQVNEATQLISLNPYALAFHLPSSASASASTERNSATQPLQRHIMADNTMGYLDNVAYGDSFESDKIDDDDEDEGWSSAFDIMDGSEGSIRQKRRDRRKLKDQTKFSSVTKEELKEQSRILGKALKK